MNRDYFTEKEWDKIFPKESVPADQQTPKPKHVNGEQQLNKSTGEVEVWYNDGWCAR